jgi:argininosuccinate synthase
LAASLTLDRGAAHLKDELMPRDAELIYNGFWFSPEREMLQALIDKSQKNVEGVVRAVGRRSPKASTGSPMSPSRRMPL